MNGELAQAVTLVAHGNAALTGIVDLDGFEARNSTFQFVRSLAIEVPSGAQGQTVAHVEEWVSELRGAGVYRLELIGGGATPISFANQGGWGLVGHAARQTSAWYGHWEVNQDAFDSADEERRIWDVTYRMFQRDGATDVQDVDLSAAIEELLGALTEARDFATRNDGLTTFADVFDRAMALADDEGASPPYHDDMLPTAGYSTEARRLLAMASQAWVFGGMGSWNDIGFADEQTETEYEEVSGRLYRGVVSGVRDAANSFDRM